MGRFWHIHNWISISSGIPKYHASSWRWRNDFPLSFLWSPIPLANISYISALFMLMAHCSLPAPVQGVRHTSKFQLVWRLVINAVFQYLCSSLALVLMQRPSVYVVSAQPMETGLVNILWNIPTVCLAAEALLCICHCRTWEQVETDAGVKLTPPAVMLPLIWESGVSCQHLWYNTILFWWLYFVV